MFIEERKNGKNLKYYLVHSYRDIDNRVCKIRRYLGKNLSEKNLADLRKRAEVLIKEQLKEQKLSIFEFSLSKKEIAKLNRHSEKIEIVHLDKKDWKRFTEDFVYNTNAIEGSMILRDDVSDILKSNKAGNTDELETIGVAEAIQFILKTKQEFSLELLKKLHELCFKGSKSYAGRFRDVEVVIRNSRGEIVHRGVPVRKLNDALSDMITWYKNNKNKFKPLILAAILHNQFEHIHPFQDGNGRVGRLLLNFILIKNKYPPINIYLEDRLEYYEVLSAYSKNQDIMPSIRFFIMQYKKTLKKVTTKTKKI